MDKPRFNFQLKIMSTNNPVTLPPIPLPHSQCFTVSRVISGYEAAAPYFITLASPSSRKNIPIVVPCIDLGAYKNANSYPETRQEKNVVSNKSFAADKCMKSGKNYSLYSNKQFFWYDNYAVVHSCAKGGQLSAIL